MKKRIFIFSAVLLALLVGILAGASYTTLTSVHIFNSLMDSTVIGGSAPRAATFTTATANTQFNGNLNGNASTATNATNAVNASNVPWAGVSGVPYPVTSSQTWLFSALSGQPTYVWGTNDGNTIQVWNPSNFNVNSAANFTGFKSFRTGGTCSTTNNAFNVCTGTFSVPGSAYTNSSTWQVVCNGITQTGFPAVIFLNPSSGSTFAYGITNGSGNGAAVSSYSSLACIAYGT